jgi:hypothetical protein
MDDSERHGIDYENRDCAAAQGEPMSAPRDCAPWKAVDAEWQPPTEQPPPGRPPEIPETEPEQPAPRPGELPERPDPTPPDSPPEVPADRAAQ